MTKKTKKTKKNTAAKAAVGKNKKTTSRRTSAPKPQSKAVAKAVSKTTKKQIQVKTVKIKDKKKVSLIQRLITVLQKQVEKLKSGLITVRMKTHRDDNGDHHHVILEDIDGRHVSVGLTRQKKKGKNSTNYKCKVNPLGNDNVQSYMRRQGTVDKKKNYGREEYQGKMNPDDYERAKIYGERAKQKYIQNKAKKK